LPGSRAKVKLHTTGAATTALQKPRTATSELVPVMAGRSRRVSEKLRMA
jgi:hypothetical protein